MLVTVSCVNFVIILWKTWQMLSSILLSICFLILLGNFGALTMDSNWPCKTLISSRCLVVGIDYLYLVRLHRCLRVVATSSICEGWLNYILERAFEVSWLSHSFKGAIKSLTSPKPITFLGEWPLDEFMAVSLLQRPLVLYRWLLMNRLVHSGDLAEPHRLKICFRVVGCLILRSNSWLLANIRSI